MTPLGSSCSTAGPEGQAKPSLSEQFGAGMPSNLGLKETLFDVKSQILQESSGYPPCLTLFHQDALFEIRSGQETQWG